MTFNYCKTDFIDKSDEKFLLPIVQRSHLESLLMPVLEHIDDGKPVVVEVQREVSTDLSRRYSRYSRDIRVTTFLRVTPTTTRNVEFRQIDPTNIVRTHMRKPEPQTVLGTLKKWFDSAFPDVVYDGPRG